MRALALLALMACTTPGVSAQDSAAFGVRVVVGWSPEAKRDLDHMATVTWHLRREQARCIPEWTLERLGGEVGVWIRRLSEGTVAHSDSVSVWMYHTAVPWDSTMKGRVCGDSLPDIHSHIVRNELHDRPSPTDEDTADRHPALFRLLMAVYDSTSYRLILYGMKGRP